MIDVDFGVQAGGKRTFRTGNDVVRYLTDRRNEWDTHPLLADRQRDIVRELKRTLLSPWDNLASEVTASQADLTQDALPRLTDNVRDSGETPKLIARDSEVGQIVDAILTADGAVAAMGAVKLYQAGPTAQLFGQLQKPEAIGAIKLVQGLEGLSSRSIRSARDASRVAIRSLEADVSSHRQLLVQLEQEHRDRLNEVAEERQRLKDDFEDWRVAIATEVQQERESWKTAWDDLYKLFTERLRLESAVKLWRDRSVEHRTEAAKWWKLSLVVAVGGLLIAGVVAWGMLDFAKWLFSDALAGPSGILTERGLRPTWQFEVIFASATLLLYLTIYFWLMRILVRLYMTEAHLEIDARSRSAMAETYLALTKDAAATDQDRAIVLASLFRPIADGIVSDDGLPAITPAAILSGWAGGKS